MGRHLQQEYGQEPQCILTMPLLEGLDGVEKMSKSKGNYVGITEPANTMFAKVLSISDELMWRWYTLAVIQGRQADIAALEGRGGWRVATRWTPNWRWRTRSPHASMVRQRLPGRQRPTFRKQMLPVVCQTRYQQLHVVRRTPGHRMRLLKQAQPGGIHQRGARAWSSRVACGWMARSSSDRGLKLPAGTYVLQVGKRKFARVLLS